MMRLYRSLLSLYPASYRGEFAEEILSVLAAGESEATQAKRWARISLRVREVGGLLSGALAAHTGHFTGFSGPAFFPRRSLMRSAFRFPKATPILMTVILVAVLMAIEKAKAISASLPPSSTPIPAIVPEQLSTVTTFLVILGLAISAGAIGWLVVFSLRRSGMQRLAEVRPPAGNTPKR